MTNAAEQGLAKVSQAVNGEGRTPVSASLGTIAGSVYKPSNADTQAGLARQELLWAQGNTNGYIDNVADGYWHIWNFDIGDATPKSEHEQAIHHDILPYITQAFNIDPYTRITVVGYASASGPVELNLNLADARAGNIANYINSLDVVAYISNHRYPSLLQFWESQQSLVNANLGEQYARSRRVEVLCDYVKPRDPTPPDIIVEPKPEKMVDNQLRVGMKVKFQWSTQGPEVLVGPHLTMRGVLEIAGVISFNTKEAAVTFELTKEMTKFKESLSAALDIANIIEVGTEGAELKYESGQYEYAVVYNPDIDKTGPLVKMTIKPAMPEVDFEQLLGKDIKAGISIELHVYFGASSALKNLAAEKAVLALEAIGSGSATVGAAAFGGGVAGTFGLLALATALVEKAKEQGQERGRLAYVITGFCYRVAALSFTDPRRHNDAVLSLEELIRRGGFEFYVFAIEGWQQAEPLLDEIIQNRQAIRDKHGQSLESIVDSLRALVFRNHWTESFDEFALPETMSELLAD